jgi:hypothetical protein
MKRKLRGNPLLNLRIRASDLVLPTPDSRLPTTEDPCAAS